MRQAGNELLFTQQGTWAGTGLETWVEARHGVSPQGLDVAVWVGWALGPVDVWRS